MNETAEAKDFLLKASKLDTKMSDDVDRREIDIGIYEISMDNNLIGEVLKTNEDGLRLLITPKSALINNNFSRFMPFPFDAMFLDHLRETKEILAD
jgi:hypothetical protein